MSGAPTTERPGARPTVNDIARVAGVSLATVDRVLNERPGVREVTVRRVLDAVASLGYVRDVSAANLARQRRYEFLFVLPGREDQFVDALAGAIAGAAEVAVNDRTRVSSTTAPMRDPTALAALLDSLPRRGVDGVAVLAPETPQLRDAVRRLKAAGLAVVALVSDLPSTERDRFVGIDNVAAGRTAGVLMGRFLGPGPARVLVLVDSMQSRDSLERRLGFDRIVAERFSELDVLPSLEGHDDAATVETILGTALETYPGVRGVYSPAGQAHVLRRALARAGGDHVVVVHELTEHSRAGLLDGSVDAVIAQDPAHVVRSALRVLRAHADGIDVVESQERIRIEVLLKENLPD